MKAIYLEEAIERFSKSGSSLSKDQIIYMLNRMPYMEIVRCGDCKHKYVKDMSAYCPHRVGAINAWDFCSFGDREGEEIQGLKYAENVLASILREQEESEE